MTAAIAATALSACATDSVSRAEMNELVASVRAMRAENARIEHRMAQLEGQISIDSMRKPQAVSSAPAAKAVVPSAPPAKDELPPLTVVKLKPKRETPTKLPTSVEVDEPDATVITDMKQVVKDGPDEEPTVDVEAQYTHALDLVKTGSVETGVAQLTQFATDWPKHPRADNALYFAGVGLMGLQDWASAVKLLDEVTKRYPAGDAVLDALLKAAECRTRLNRPAEARAVYRQIVSSYPGTAAASAAQARLTDPR